MAKTAPLSATPSNARQVLEQRAAVLASLGSGAFQGSAPLTHNLQQSWHRERLLIERVLEETGETDPVLATLDRWEARTSAFQAKAGQVDAGWTDRQGMTWQADQVLAMIADLRDRLSSWRERDGTPPAQAATSAEPGAAAPDSGPVRPVPDPPGGSR